MSPQLAMLFTSMGFGMGLLVAWFVNDWRDRKRSAEIRRLRTQLRLAKPVGDSVAPPVADGPDR
jgi:hypothetical protein